MGEPAKVSSFRFPDDTRRQLAELHGAFSPAFPGDSELVRFIIRVFHAIVCGGRLLEVGPGLQRLLGKTSFTQPALAASGEWTDIFERIERIAA